MRSRLGATLVEAVVALVLFQFGLLALAAATAQTAQDLAAANRRVRAQAISSHRVERLRANVCPAPVTGSAEWTGGLIEHWSVRPAGVVRAITDSIEFLLPRGRRSHHVLRGWMLCGP